MSSTTYANPDYNRGNQGSLAGVIEQYLTEHSKNTDGMLPAKVISYDRETNIAAVQPQIMQVAYNGTLIKRAPVALVPVLALGGGGFVINFPLPAGSPGWIEACDRDISLYMQSGNETAPNTKRMHSFADSRFIPDFGGAYTINTEDANNMVIQTTNGDYRIALWADRIKITTPGGTAELNATRIKFSTPRFDVNSPLIQFATAPIIGPIPP